MSDLREFLDAIIGDTSGRLHAATGRGPYLTAQGKYKHMHWTPSQFVWPAEADQAERELLAAATDSDVYVCPYLMHGDKRTPGGVVARWLAHADVDHGHLDPDKVRQLDGLAVASGTPGNAHVYIALSESVPAPWHQALCRGLGDYLGGADAKISSNDVLRPPGTFNHKPTVRGGAPAPVQWLVKPPGARVAPHALACQLGVILPDGRTATTGTGPAVAAEPVDLHGYPTVKTALEHVTGDRSADTMRVVGACYNAGLTQAQTRRVVSTRADLAARLAERNDDDVLTCWLKAIDSRQQRKTNAESAHNARCGDMESATPMTLPDAHNVFRRWLGEDYDTDALDAMLAATAVERFEDGSDPVWLLIVSGPGAAKTETVQALDGIGALVVSSISSDAALLSATPARERAKKATGGLLRRIGPRGVLVVKDVTSILSMNRDLRAKVLAALREVYDGRWSREVGSDGGHVLHWSGRLAVIGAVTTAWDTAHGVIATMGDRFCLIRIDSTKARSAAGRRAIGNTGDEPRMRAELAVAAAGVIAGMNAAPITVTEAETNVLLAAADLVTLARTGVEYDYRGDVIDAHAPEMPTRFAKQLAQIVRGAVAIGMNRQDGLRLAIRCARDSTPPLRLAIIDDLAAHPDSSTAEIRKRLDKPRATVDRQLQALHMLGVVDCDEQETIWAGRESTRWYYRLAVGVEPTALDPKSVPDLSLHTPSPHRRGGRETDGQGIGTNKSGTDSKLCPACGRAPARADSGLCDLCSVRASRQQDGEAAS